MPTSNLNNLVEQRVWMGNVSWETYETLAADSANPRGLLAYDQGVLEIMSPSFFHENIKRLIGRLIEMYTFEKNIEMRSVGSTTVKRKMEQSGFEADESYYIQHAIQMRHVEETDFSIHPAPDLVVEVDISRSSDFKLPLYFRLGVAEVWKYDGEILQVLVPEGDQFVEAKKSQCLPNFPFELAQEILTNRAQLSENELLRQFMAAITAK